MRRLLVAVVTWSAVGGLILLTGASAVASSRSLSVPGAGAAASTLVVDKDKVQCPDAAFTSIQAAVNAAAPGDTVRVCADLYTEAVTVDKALVIEAKGGEPREMHCLDLPAPPDPTRDAVVKSGPIAFQVLADGVTIDGFVIEPVATGVRGGIGVSRLLVRNTLIENAAIGVSFGPSGASPSVLDSNCLRDLAIGVNLRTPSSNVTVQRNTFARNFQGVVVRQGSADITVDRNRSVEDGIFALVFPSTRLAITRNTVLRSQDGAVAAIAVGGTMNSLIDRNTITGGLGNGIGFAGPGQGVPANVNILVSRNVIDHMGLSGIRTTPDSLQDSSILRNTSIENMIDGIRIEAGANTGNRIDGNVIRGNSGLDCHDDTIGTGTSGTANVWTNDVGLTENPPGLCHASRDGEQASGS